MWKEEVRIVQAHIVESKESMTIAAIHHSAIMLAELCEVCWYKRHLRRPSSCERTRFAANIAHVGISRSIATALASHWHAMAAGSTSVYWAGRSTQCLSLCFYAVCFL